jgi:hypothetical protein
MKCFLGRITFSGISGLGIGNSSFRVSIVHRYFLSNEKNPENQKKQVFKNEK